MGIHEFAGSIPVSFTNSGRMGGNEQQGSSKRPARRPGPV